MGDSVFDESSPHFYQCARALATVDIRGSFSLSKTVASGLCVWRWFPKMTAKPLHPKWHHASHEDDLAKLIVGKGRIFDIEKSLSKSKVELNRLC